MSDPIKFSILVLLLALSTATIIIELSGNETKIIELSANKTTDDQQQEGWGPGFIPK